MENVRDAYGQQLLAQYNSQTATAEIIERDDDYIDTGSDAGLYFTEHDQWSSLERQVVERARGRILDIGCGAGRHALYLQQQGFDVVGVDNSPGAIEVCKARGLKKALVRAIDDIGEFPVDSFDTILMLGNNFGLFGSRENAKLILEKMNRITTPDAQIVAGTRNPYDTDAAEHLQYHEFNRKRGRMPGQLRMRVRFGKTVGEWFDYLFVSPPEMKTVLEDTDWRVEEFVESFEPNYFAVIKKKVG